MNHGRILGIAEQWDKLWEVVSWEGGRRGMKTQNAVIGLIFGFIWARNLEWKAEETSEKDRSYKEPAF